MHDVVLRFIQTSWTEESVTERTTLIAAAWQMISSHPFFGVGLHNFLPALAPIQKPAPLNLYLQPVHNIFMLVAAETGIIGLLGFLLMLGATVWHLRTKHANKTMLILLAVIITTGMFDHYWLTLQQGQLLFATVLGLAWSNYGK